MKFQIIQPSGILARFVKHYWVMETDPSEDPVTERVIPTGNIEMMFHYGTPFLVNSEDEKNVLQPRNFVSGISSNFADVSTCGKSGVIAVTFYPYGACNFFKFPLSEIEGVKIDLNDIFSREFNEVEEKMQSLPNLSQKISVIETFLLNQFHPVHANDFSFLNYSLSLINQRKGQISANELSENLLVSSRSLERKFSNLLGKTPKQFLKIVRFQDIIHSLSVCNNLQLTQLAYEKGYFDQAHFIKEFKSMAGYTPREFVNFFPCRSDYSGLN